VPDELSKYRDKRDKYRDSNFIKKAEEPKDPEIKKSG
jgi:hypothetical protein